MCRRLFASLSLVALIVIVSLASSIEAQAQRGAGKTWVAPRTPWGEPDLQGIWTNIRESGTPFERPAELTKKGITDPKDPEALRQQQTRDKDPAVRRQAAQAVDEAGGRGTGAGPVHWYESLDPKKSQLWFVVDPPDGKIPPLTPEAQKKAAARTEARRGLGNDEPTPGGWVEDLSTMVRCITRGLPAIYVPGAYNNNYQITQSPGYVAIHHEWMHDTRVIPLDGRPHIPAHVRQLMGDSRGRWEGDTLIVDTTNFTDKTNYRGAGEHLHLVERFTRVAPDTIDWRVTLEDPTTWTRSWTFAIPLTKDDTQQWIFEYACHEGNYGISHILSGARAKEREAQEAASRK